MYNLYNLHFKLVLLNLTDIHNYKRNKNAVINKVFFKLGCTNVKLFHRFLLKDKIMFAFKKYFP